MDSLIHHPKPAPSQASRHLHPFDLDHGLIGFHLDFVFVYHHVNTLPGKSLRKLSVTLTERNMVLDIFRLLFRIRIIPSCISGLLTYIQHVSPRCGCWSRTTKDAFTIDLDAVLRAYPFPRARIVGVCLDQNRLIDRTGRELNMHLLFQPLCVKNHTAGPRAAYVDVVLDNLVVIRICNHFSVEGCGGVRHDSDLIEQLLGLLF